MSQRHENFLPMVVLLVENAYELRIDKKTINSTRSYGHFGQMGDFFRDF